MDFLRSYSFKDEPLIIWPFLSSKLDSPVIKTFKRHFFTPMFWLCTGESNFDERIGQEMFNWSEVHS